MDCNANKTESMHRNYAKKQLQIRELEITIKYLITRYEKEKYNELMPHVESIVFFILNSISKQYYNDKETLLEIIKVYEDIVIKEKVSVPILLNLMPKTKNDGGEILEELYNIYYECISEKIFNLYIKYGELFFDAHECYNDDYSLNQEMIRRWRINKSYIIDKSIKNSNYETITSDISDKEINPILLSIYDIENSKDPRVIKMVQEVQKKYYKEHEHKTYKRNAKPLYITKTNL